MDLTYGYALDSEWCLNVRNTPGTIWNRYFWGCGTIYTQEVGGQDGPVYVPAVTSKSAQSDLTYELYMANYTDAQDVSYAVIRGRNVDTSVDWMAHSYAASTSCHAIAPSLCAMNQRPTNDTKYGLLWPFNCSSEHEGLVGNMTASAHDIRFERFHKYAVELQPFTNTQRPTEIAFQGPVEVIKTLL